MVIDIGFLVYPQFQLLDLGGPVGVFQTAGQIGARQGDAPPYRLRVVSAEGGLVPSSSGVAVMTEPLGDEVFDSFVVVGGGALHSQPDKVAPLALIARRYAANSRRVGSVCTGAFVLAAAGFLDGRSATTHWMYAAALQRLHPRVRVDGDRIFIHDGPMWTSAGITAGIDFALALVEEDLGVDIARAVARRLVVYHRRSGGQSQFSTLLELEPTSDRMRAALGFAREHLHEKLPVERLAQVACLSPRQFARAFTAETGESPAKAVERMRAEAARQRIETSTEPIEAIAQQVGFADPERMRRAFVRLFGHPPQSIRRHARAAAQGV
jgi:transcriptional regulator GlxA family with amidase domain